MLVRHKTRRITYEGESWLEESWTIRHLNLTRDLGDRNNYFLSVRGQSITLTTRMLSNLAALVKEWGSKS